MTEKTIRPCNKKPANEAEPLLGKRHETNDGEQKSFKAVAQSIGFTPEELRALGRIYFGPARPDTPKNNR